MHAYERIADGQYRSHETVQLFGWSAPVTCLCGLTSDKLTRLVNPGTTRATVTDCPGCGHRRAEHHVDVRAAEADPWHSIARSDPSRTLCGTSASDDWLFYPATGRPAKSNRCATCEQARTHAAATES